MNFDLPLLLSDLTGSSSDLVEEGKNGCVFKMGDVDELADLLAHIISLPEAERRQMGAHSGRLIEGYSYAQVSDALHKIINKVHPQFIT